MNFFCVFTGKSGDFMSRCEPLCSILFVKLNLPAVDWRDIVCIPCNLENTFRTFSGSNREKIRTSSLSSKIRRSYKKTRVYASGAFVTPTDTRARTMTNTQNALPSECTAWFNSNKACARPPAFEEKGAII